MARGKSVNYVDFSGGVNANSGEYLLAENQAKDARNFQPTPIGSLRKRDGFSLNADLSDDFTYPNGVFAVKVDGNELLLVSGIDSTPGTAALASVIGGTVDVLKQGLDEDGYWEWVQAPLSGGQGPIYGVNGLDTPQQWDGSASSTSDWTASTGTVPSTARFVIYHTDRVWATGSLEDDETGRVWYSGLTSDAIPAPDPRNWDTDNYVDIEPQDGNAITGIGRVGPYLGVWKPRNTYIITDPVTGAWRQVSDNIGCSAHRSIAETEEGTFFLSEEAGVCRTDGSAIEVVGDPVLPFIRQAAINNASYFPFCAGFYWRNSYYLSIPYEGNQSTNDLTLEYDLTTKSWWVHSVGFNQLALIDDSDGIPVLYSADPDDEAPRISQAFDPDVYTDNGVPYETSYTSAYLSWGEPHLNKQVRQFRMDGNGTWDLSAATSFRDEYDELDGVPLEVIANTGTFGGEGVFGGAGTFGPDTDVTQWAYFTPGFGRAWSLKIENEDERPLEVFSLAAFIDPRTD